MEDKALELTTRREIFELIEEFPGLHLREIERQLDLSSALAEYHLIALRKNDLINSVEEGGYKRYYPHYKRGEGGTKPALSREEKRIVGILREVAPFRIVLFLMGREFAQHKEIRDAHNISKSTLSYHLKKLLELGMLEKRARGPNRGFFIPDKKRIQRLMIQYKPTPDVLRDYGDVWMKIYSV